MKIGDRCIVIGVTPFDVPDDHVVLDLKTFPCLGVKPVVVGPAGREGVYVAIFQKSSIRDLHGVLDKCFPEQKVPVTEEDVKKLLEQDLRSRSKLTYPYPPQPREAKP